MQRARFVCVRRAGKICTLWMRIYDEAGRCEKQWEISGRHRQWDAKREREKNIRRWAKMMGEMWWWRRGIREPTAYSEFDSDIDSWALMKMKMKRIQKSEHALNAKRTDRRHEIDSWANAKTASANHSIKSVIERQKSNSNNIQKMANMKCSNVLKWMPDSIGKLYGLGTSAATVANIYFHFGIFFLSFAVFFFCCFVFGMLLFLLALSCSRCCCY